MSSNKHLNTVIKFSVPLTQVTDVQTRINKDNHCINSNIKSSNDNIHNQNIISKNRAIPIGSESQSHNQLISVKIEADETLLSNKVSNHNIIPLANFTIPISPVTDPQITHKIPSSVSRLPYTSTPYVNKIGMNKITSISLPVSEVQAILATSQDTLSISPVEQYPAISTPTTQTALLSTKSLAMSSSVSQTTSPLTLTPAISKSSNPIVSPGFHERPFSRTNTNIANLSSFDQVEKFKKLENRMLQKDTVVRCKWKRNSRGKVKRIMNLSKSKITSINTLSGNSPINLSGHSSPNISVDSNTNISTLSSGNTTTNTDVDNDTNITTLSSSSATNICFDGVTNISAISSRITYLPDGDPASDHYSCSLSSGSKREASHCILPSIAKNHSKLSTSTSENDKLLKSKSIPVTLSLLHTSGSSSSLLPNSPSCSKIDTGPRRKITFSNSNYSSPSNLPSLFFSEKKIDKKNCTNSLSNLAAKEVSAIHNSSDSGQTTVNKRSMNHEKNNARLMNEMKRCSTENETKEILHDQINDLNPCGKKLTPIKRMSDMNSQNICKKSKRSIRKSSIGTIKEVAQNTQADVSDLSNSSVIRFNTKTFYSTTETLEAQDYPATETEEYIVSWLQDNYVMMPGSYIQQDRVYSYFVWSIRSMSKSEGFDRFNLMDPIQMAKCVLKVFDKVELQEIGIDLLKKKVYKGLAVR
ncbi:unnamed protein product, partial [Meganyctiphanes norvegica]